MKSLPLLTLAAALAFSLPAITQEPAPQLPKATLDLEWEAVKDANGYEIELVPKSGGPVLRFTTEQSSITQQIQMGMYTLRIRSKETESGIYGAWSDSTEVDLTTKQIELIAPEDQEEFETETVNSLSVELKWTPVHGAKNYYLKIWSDDPAKAKEFKTDKTAVKIKLPGMKKYNWQVMFDTVKSISYRSEPKTRSFIVKGPKLKTPEFDDVDFPTITELSWSESPGADDYQVTIYRRAIDEADYQEFKVNDELKEVSWSFEKLPPGAYRLEVSAHAEFRGDSDVDVIEFILKPTKQELMEVLAKVMKPELRAPTNAEPAQTSKRR